MYVSIYPSIHPSFVGGGGVGGRGRRGDDDDDTVFSCFFFCVYIQAPSKYWYLIFKPLSSSVWFWILYGFVLFGSFWRSSSWPLDYITMTKCL
jgi:hypothetical protein